MTNAARLPLSGLRVVTLEQAVAAPFCSRQLADMGADVVKVERPGIGDPARAYDSAIRGTSAYFAWLNRGKRSVALELSSPDAHDAFARLLARADVFVHNLAPGSVERLGFGYDTLAPTHPRLIWCGISGYGPDGPRRDSKAYDMLVQAESGVMSLTGGVDAPAKVGISIADISAGLYAYSSILAALIQRGVTGAGERIDISMLECLTEWMMPPLYVWKGMGTSPARAGMRHNMIVPYGAYPCADGAVMFAIQNAAEWRRFCDGVMATPALADDERFSTNELRLANRAALEALIEQRFASRRRSEVLTWLETARIATATVNDVPAVAEHPQLAARGRWTTVSSPGGDIPALRPPHNLRGAPARMGAIPALGEHTDDVLAEIEPRDSSAVAATLESPGGHFFEDFAVGMVLRHAVSRTVTTADNTGFSLMTCNANPIHFDREYSARTEFGKPLVNSAFTLGLLTGLSVADMSRNAINLGWDEVRMPAPVFEGDTIHAQSEVLSVRESKSRPTMGIVEFTTTGFKQDETVVMAFRRTILVYKRGHGPSAGGGRAL